jgi:hypothetical protein
LNDFEPALNATLNVTKWFRVGANVSYRFAGDVYMVGLSESDVGGPAVSLELRFGEF